MKKGWRTAFACVIIYVLSFGATAVVMGTDTTERELIKAEVTAVEVASSQTDYIVKEYNGAVAVFLNGEAIPLIETDIPVSGLRQNDKALVERGISLQSYTEVLGLLEDFGS